MSEAAAIFGDAVDTALLARAVDRTGGDGAPPTNRQCLNCATPLAGAYCYNCGQRGDIHRSLIGFAHDIAHGTLHLDGKFWRTLPLLVWRPGQLTRAYIDGQRARYVSPIFAFLFATFLVFAVFDQVLGKIGNAADIAVNGKHIAGLAANEKEIKRLQALRATFAAAHRPTRVIDAEIAGRRKGIDGLEALSNPVGAIGEGHRCVSGHSDWPALTDAINAACANPALASLKVETNAHKFTWALIPMSLPFVWLLFPFSRSFGLFDHLVFVTYSISFVMLIIVAQGLLGLLALNAQWLENLLGLAIPVHMYRQLRGTYALSRRAALWRLPLLLTFAVIVLTLWAVLLLALLLTG